MKPKIKIAPSILAADFARLGEQIAEAAAAGADQIHIDVMDGHFVPNLSMGPAVVEALRRVTDLPFDVHLMVFEPERYLSSFASAGANAITVHAEACKDIAKTMQAVHDLGLRAGVAFRPATPLGAAQNVFPAADIILLMTVEPGFGGQAYLPESDAKIKLARQTLTTLGSDADISVDGGIDHDTALRAVSSGANVLVAGSAIFHHPGGIAKAVEALDQARRRS